MAEEKEKPLTREDVLRLIEENGGTAQGLDLSGKVFQESIDLSGLDLNGIILKEAILFEAHLEGAHLAGAHLEEASLGGIAIAEEAGKGRGAHLERAWLRDAHLERADLEAAHLEGADLRGAHLEGAHLDGAHLEGAWLFDAHLEGVGLWIAHLEGAHLSKSYLEAADLNEAHLEGAYWGDVEFPYDTKLENADWGNHILGEERIRSFPLAEDTYRRLKIWYTEHGKYSVAGEFFFREMTAKRKAMSWWLKPWNRGWSKFISLICGYGERPFRVVASAVVIVLGLALIYFAIGTLTPNTLLNSLYYSAVSFTALGYGQWAPTPEGWVKGLGAAQVFIGVFMMALFLITFTRKMTK